MYNNLQVYVSKKDQIMYNNFYFILLIGHVSYVGNIKNNYLLYFCPHWPISDFLFLISQNQRAADNVIKFMKKNMPN